MDIAWALNQSVNWASQTGTYDQYAQPIYQPKGTIPARVVRKVQLVKNSDGVDVASDTQVHVTAPVLIGDKITYNGRERKVISARDGLALYAGAPSFYILYL